MQEILPEYNSILKATKQKAQSILEQNTSSVIYGSREYRRTVPSKEYYVHQWNWDSACVAMGLVHFDANRAYDELRSLVSGQWENGMIAHVTYNPDDNSYYPQADKWKTDAFWQHNIPTSGITNPPVLGIAVEYIYRHSPDKEAAGEFLRDVLPATLKFHEYLKNYRDPEDNGLLTIIHPWESGTDNSPRWDTPYKDINTDAIPQHVKDDVDINRVDHKKGNASHRPRNKDYYRYMGIIDTLSELNWDYKKIVKESPFAVKDIAFSSIWARANESLAHLLNEMGQTEEAQKYHTWAEQTKSALAATWSEEHQQYCDINVAQGKHEPIVEPTSSMFLPLLAGAVTDEQLPHVISRLSDKNQFWPAYPVPSTALNSEKFDLSRYWRGPTWPVINMFLIEGLKRYENKNEKAKDMSETLIDSTLEMISGYGFYEYYDPTNGQTRGNDESEYEKTFGFGSFSWTAAMFILLQEKYRQPHQHLSVQTKESSFSLFRPSLLKHRISHVFELFNNRHAHDAGHLREQQINKSQRTYTIPEQRNFDHGTINDNQ